MLTLYLLLLFVSYYGGVLWLALRFKHKPWRWHWFFVVVVSGMGWVWWDKIFIYQVVEKDWCQRTEVGFHELMPVHLADKDVTWLTPAHWPNGNVRGLELTPESKRLVEERKFVIVGDVQATSSNRLICGSPPHIKHESAACIASGYRVQTEIEDIRILGRHIATKEHNLLMRDETVLREAVEYEWSEKSFLDPFRTGMLATSGQCGVSKHSFNSTRIKAVDVKE